MDVVEGQSQGIRAVGLADFDMQVLQCSAQHPVLVDFWAAWCAPCLVIAPVLEQLVAEYAGAFTLAKIEVDVGDNMKLAGRYRVRGFPTLMLFRDGQQQGHFSGAHPARYIRDFLEQHDVRPHSG